MLIRPRGRQATSPDRYRSGPSANVTPLEKGELNRSSIGPTFFSIKAMTTASMAGHIGAKLHVTRCLRVEHVKEGPVLWTRSGNTRLSSSAGHRWCQRKSEPKPSRDFSRSRHGRKTKGRCRCKTPEVSFD